MRIALRQIAVDVLFEKEPVDHERRHGLLFLLLFLRLARIGIVDDQRDALAIRRPGEVVNATFRVGYFFGLTAADREQPKLIVLVFIFAAREKPDPFSIGAPARVFLSF